MKTGKLCVMVFFCVCACTLSALYAKESYEDYRGGREDYFNNDKPLPEINSGDFMDDLREAVSDEIDSAMSKERKASTRKIQNKSKLIQEVRQIVRNEIEEAINLKQKAYLSKGIIEIGGFFSLQVSAIEGNEQDNHLIIKFLPSCTYYFLPSFGINVRVGIDINLTTNIQNYYGLVGPQFVFPMDRREKFLFFTTFLIGITYSSNIGQPLGYRFGNDLGIKFIFSMGFAINVGLMIAFDNAGQTVSGFQDLIVPTIGITAWF